MPPPVEIRRLAARLDDLVTAGSTDHELFPVFADRVRRSADQAFALVTLYDQL